MPPYFLTRTAPNIFFQGHPFGAVALLILGEKGVGWNEACLSGCYTLSLFFISSGPPTDSSPLTATRFSPRRRQSVFRKRHLDLSACRRQGFRCGRMCGESMAIPVASSSPHENPQTEPAVFRPRAARIDDEARRPVETLRSFRCRWAEPIAPQGCPCPAKDAFGIGGNNRGTKQGSVSDAVRLRRSRGSGIRASRCRSVVPHTDSAMGFVAP